MKILCVEELSKKICGNPHVFFSLVGYDFHAEYSPDLFLSLKEHIVFKDKYLDRDGEEEDVSYIHMPNATGIDTVLSYLTHGSVALFVSAKNTNLFVTLPSLVVAEARNPWDAKSAAALAEIYFMTGYEWMALRDGDVGDHFFYYFER